MFITRARVRSPPVPSASQADGEVCRAVRLVCRRHDGVGSGGKTAGHADVLSEAVGDATSNGILGGQHRSTSPLWDLDGGQVSLRTRT